MVLMSLENVFKKVTFLLGAGASVGAGCLSSPSMLIELKKGIQLLDKPDDNGKYSKYKELQNQFEEIYNFIVASLRYQYSLKDSRNTINYTINIEDFVMVLKQIIDREFIVPYPLVGNWNDKITKWELSNNEEDVFIAFLNYIIYELTTSWTDFDVRKGKSLLKPFKDILNLNLQGSLYKLITTDFDIKLKRSIQEIKAVILDNRITTLFEMPKNSPGFFMKNLTFDENDTPIELLYSYYRGDKYKLELELDEYQMP